jgi:hypothetical protein
MRHSLGRAVVAMMSVVVLAACGQIGNTHGSSSSSPSGSLPPGGTAARSTPLPGASVSPADTCVTVRQLSAVEKQVTGLFGRFDELEQSEDVVADLGELVSGFQAAQADLAAIPTVVEDRGITEARRLLGEAITGFIAGLQELSKGYETSDQQTLVNAALKLDAANKTFANEYQPAIETKANCL